MVAYSFKARFAAPILAGTKAQTIRALGKRPTRHAYDGCKLQFYTGMRTRQCRKIADAICRDAPYIAINLVKSEVTIRQPIAAEGSRISIFQPRGLDDFARSDGFADWSDMVAFWRKEHPGVEVFEGVLIRWHALVPAGECDVGAVA